MMNFKMAHTEIHVLDLDASLNFYERALGLVPVREKGPEDGSWKLVFLGNDSSDHLLELTWNRGRVEPYNQGGRDIHLAFEVDDIDAAHELHESLGCIVKENPSMGIYFIEDPDGFYIEIAPAR